MTDDLVVAPGVTIPGECLSWTAVRSSGPGGQNVNKVSTKVDLRLDLDACDALPEAAKARLRAMPRVRLDAEGRVVVVSEATRSRTQNIEDARQRLAALVARALVAPKKRKPTRPSRASRQRRLEAKTRQSERKRARSRVQRDTD